MTTKISQGSLLIVSKLLALIEEKMRIKVTDEVTDQLEHMMIKEGLLTARPVKSVVQQSETKSESLIQSILRSGGDKTLIRSIIEWQPIVMDSSLLSQNERNQFVSIIEMDQSLSKKPRDFEDYL